MHIFTETASLSSHNPDHHLCNQNEAKIIKNSYLLASNDSAGFTLDDHILSATNVQTSRSKCSRLIKVIHDPSYFLGFELNEQTSSLSYHKQKQINQNRNRSLTIIFNHPICLMNQQTTHKSNPK